MCGVKITGQPLIRPYFRFYLPVGAAYVRKFLSEDVKKGASDILASIKAEFMDVVTHLEWFDEATRKRALEQLSTTVDYVAYPNALITAHHRIEEHFNEVC